ncbi:unnamed protein product [Onchocerca ochengi]|uniref:DUF1758 domain-containing protein n=1 Tax=Onchocerca ochengi TaxID=42157 RepID=A0A182EVC0_ONCOC|nr:unnamed protein product [Onchocerca ochengi]
MLEIVNAEWRQYIQQISTPVKRKEEEDKHAPMVDEKTGKPKSYLQHSPNESSALVTNVPKKSEDGKQKGTKIRRPCAFCKKDHWDNEGYIYSALKQRMELVNPTMHEMQEDAIVLLDTGSESSFISRKLAQRLNLEEGEHSMIKISIFSNKQLGPTPVIQQ